MELVILLIIFGLFILVILGPVGFFKAHAAALKIARLQNEVERLSIELSDTRSLTLRMYDRYWDRGQLTGTRNVAAEEATAEPPIDEVVNEPEVAEEVISELTATSTATVEEPEPAEEANKEPIEPETEQEPTTLQRLLELRQQPQDDEQTTVPPLQQPVEEVAEADPVEPPVIGSAKPEEPVVATSSPEPEPQLFASKVTIVPPVVPDEPTDVPARRLTIEEVLAGKVFVWIGAIALVLTAAFLLKLGFDSGIITEPVRVIAAAVFGLALWAVGEWTRSRVSLISQALCGAAVAVLYASVLAAHSLYGLFGPGGGTLAFGLMATISAAAILLSLRHGPAVAILGMLGGFMLPPVLNQELIKPTSGMVLYLVAIEIGVLAVTGKRGWFGISLMTLIFSFAWSIGYVLIGDDPHERTLTAFLVIGTAAAYLFHTARIHRDPAATPGTRRRVLGLSIAATCSAIGVTALLVLVGDFSMQDLGMLWLVAAGTLVLARIDARQIAMPFVAMGLSLMVLLSDVLLSLPSPPSSTLITMSAAFGGLFTLGGYLCMWGSPHRKVFAVMSAIAGPAAYGIVVLAGHDAYGLRGFWWPYTLGLAGLYALATVPMLLRRKADHDWPIALFSVLSFVLVCITLGQSMDHPRFAVCLALVSAVVALIDLRLFIRPLRLAGCIVAFISAGLLVAPGPFDMTIQGGPVFNTLLPMYALPALAFGIIAWAGKRAGSEATAQNLTWLCMVTLAGMLLVLIRDIFQPGGFLETAFALYEWSTYATVLLLACFVGHWVANRLGYEPIHQATRWFIGIAAVLALVGGLVPSNPLFHAEVVGGFNLAAGLLALYAAPAALLWRWTRRASIQAVPQLAEVLRAVSITLFTLFVAFQIRNGFQGSGFQGNPIGLFECVAYAIAWLTLGGFMQQLNQRRLQSPVTRVAGQLIFAIGLITTVVGGVFVFNPLFDTDAVGGWGLAARMLVLYALPAVLLWAWSRGKTFADQPIMAGTLRGTALTLIALFVGLQIRNGFQSDSLQTQGVSFYECIAYMVAAMLLGGFIQMLNDRYLKDTVTGVAGQIIFAIGFATTLIGSVIVFNPVVDQTAEGGWGLIPRLAALYILPAALMWLWSRGKTLRDQAELTSGLRGSSIVYITFFVGLLIRNAFHASDLHALQITMFECATYGLAWVCLGFAFHFIAPRCTLPGTTGHVGRSILGIGLLTLLVGNVLVLNPLWLRESVGMMPILNGLWYLYGPLILILVLLARKARRDQRPVPAKLTGFMAVGLSFMLLSMLVRQGFSGDGLVVIKSGLADAERYAYSLAWVLFGAALLVAGVFTRLDTLRYGSLAVLLLAVGKVFLIDTANLENLYRVFSFFGLGVTLIALGYLYQRLVFKRPGITDKAQTT